jgi:hypothetical protein
LADIAAALSETLDPGRAAEIAVQRALPDHGDMGAIVTMDDRGKWQTRTAHTNESEHQVLDELFRRYPPSLDSQCR